MEQWTGSKLGKEYNKTVYCYLAYLIYMQSISCKMPDWMNHKLESRFLGEISITSDMQMIPPLWQKAKRNWRASWWKWKRVKSWLHIQHSKTKIMASGPFTSWQIDGETVETVTGFISLGSKITADGDCSHEIKRHLLLGRRATINLNSIKKQRCYFANKGLYSQVCFFQWSCMDVRGGL